MAQDERYVRVTLPARGVVGRARLLTAEAPRTCAAVWAALPAGGQIYHGKYARNEVYTLIPHPGHEPGSENTTVTPIPGDLCWFTFTGDQLGSPAYGYESAESHRDVGSIVDLALFYGRNNLLINGDQGWIPGNVFATVVDGLPELAAACQDIWMGGARGERLEFTRDE